MPDLVERDVKARSVLEDYFPLVLLERDTELGVVAGLLDDVRAGKGRVLILEGPPGIGKTELLHAVQERAAEAGVDVLPARASQLDRGFSFGVARQLLERRVRDATAKERAALLDGAAQGALPALGIAEGDAEGDAGMRSLHGLYWLVANLAGRGPLVLCVDDAHWADRSSLQWLLYCAPRLTGLPLGVVMATRATEPGAEQDLLDALALDDSTTVAKVEPLSPAAVGTLVDEGLPGATATEFEAACHHSTGGNPLLVRELLRELASEGVAPSVESAGRLDGFGVEAVARNVRSRLHELGPQAAAIAQAVAVVGDGATVIEIAALSECDEGAVRSVAVDLAAADLLRSDTLLSFVHPLVRAAVYEEMAAVEREALHRSVAELRGESGEPEQVAVHLLRVEPATDPDTVDVLRAAAAEARMRGAPDAAATFLRRALAEQPAAGAMRATVLVELGQAEALARMEGFAEHLGEAIAELEDPEQAAAVALSLTLALGALGQGAAALGVLEEALASVDPQGTMAPLLEAELLGICHGAPDLRHRAAAQVRGHVQRLERGEAVDPAIQGALSMWLLREHPPAERAVQAAETAVAEYDPERQTPSTTAMLLSAYALMHSGRIDRAGKIFDSITDAAKRRGEQPILGLLATLRSEAFYRQGAVMQAEEQARASWGHAIGEGLAIESPPIGLVFAGGMLINALVARAELDEAQHFVDRMPELLPERSEMLLPARAELRLAQGRVEEAIEDLRATGELLGDEFPKPVQNWRARLAVALASAGEREEARALAAAELEQARLWEVPLAIGVALTAAGVAEGGEEGASLLEEAVATLARTEGRLDHALALIELGALLRRNGSRVAAREPLRLGMDLAARCLATAHADRAHAELVAAGARPRRDRRFLTGPEALTAGEMRVASLAAEGLTDRAIAQRLHVTQAAVQFHLRNTFRKLDVHARGELAAALDPQVTEAKA